jgi:hypothetical protein
VRWPDYPICPPCLDNDCAHCDGGTFWCEHFCLWITERDE